MSKKRWITIKWAHIIFREDGNNLSGGQWQKIALARAAYNYINHRHSGMHKMKEEVII